MLSCLKILRFPNEIRVNNRFQAVIEDTLIITYELISVKTETGFFYLVCIFLNKNVVIIDLSCHIPKAESADHLFHEKDGKTAVERSVEFIKKHL